MNPPRNARRTLVAAALLPLALATACGQAARSSDTGTEPDSVSTSPSTSASASPGETPGPRCAVDPATVEQVRGTPVVARPDLDGDGKPDPVHLLPESSTVCGVQLVAELGGSFVAAAVGDLAPASYQSLSVPGRDGDVLAVHVTHPRGGYQDLLFAADGTTFGQVMNEVGHPLLPFVATDTDQTPHVAVTCTTGGFTIQRSVAHRPVGVMFAWDVVRERVLLKGLQARSSGAEKVRDNVLPSRLDTVFPRGTEHQTFAGCGNR